MKYLVVTGGVVSGLGKGISISSLGLLLKAHGCHITSIKIDPYLNVDAGTMSPIEHGEVFVLNDGGEADLDLGNYERFLDITLTRDHNITTGKMYKQVIEAERRGDYLGKTVQVIPHITDAVQDWIERVARMPVEPSTSFMTAAAAAAAAGGVADADAATSTPRAAGGAASGACSPVSKTTPDLCLIEVGGTVGDIESEVFIEALRQLANRVGRENVVFVHVSLVPMLGTVGEQKTKPTQHSVKELRSLGISPDIIIARSHQALHRSTKEKLSGFCHVPVSQLLTVADVPNIFHVPLMLYEQGAVDVISRLLRLNLPLAAPPPFLRTWRGIAATVDELREGVTIALVGKYTGLQDSYLSVIKALQHAAIFARRRLSITWIDASSLEVPRDASGKEAHEEGWRELREAHGVLVPGGFGERGTEGMIAAITHARESGKPFFGICLGMQLAVIEFARSVLRLPGATSGEFDPAAEHKAIVFMPEGSRTAMGGTMRLGARATHIRGKVTLDERGRPAAAGGAPLGSGAPICLAHELYGHGVGEIWERHRHRYEVNPELVGRLQAAGLWFTGTDDSGQRMEIVELDRGAAVAAGQHPYFVAVQYHPEFQSHPTRPSPPFLGLVYAASGQLEGNLPLRVAEMRRLRGLAVAAPAAVAVGSAGAAPVPLLPPVPQTPLRESSGSASSSASSAASSTSGGDGGPPSAGRKRNSELVQDGMPHVSSPQKIDSAPLLPAVASPKLAARAPLVIGAAAGAGSAAASGRGGAPRVAPPFVTPPPEATAQVALPVADMAVAQ